MTQTTAGDYDTLIVGAGAAGLAAARALAAGGERVLLIEARNRVGGRIFTTHIAPAGGGEAVSVELGAEFVHGKPPATWSLIDEAGLDTYELEGRPFRFADGRLEQGSPEESATRVLDDMMDWLRAQPAATDLTFDAYLRTAAVEPRQARQARAYVEGFNAADASRIGIAALARQQRAEEAIHADRLFHVRGGYDSITNYLAKEAQKRGAVIALAHVVRHIRWSRGRVAAAGSQPHGEFEFNARRAVITLPLGVLQARRVCFDPGPGTVLTHADAMAMGAAARVSLLFASTWWKDAAGLGFLFAAGEPIPTWWTALPNPVPLLTGWAGGPKAAALSGTVAHSFEDAAVGLVAKFFGTSASGVRASLLGAYRHDWQTDEFSLGAYSYAPAGALEASAHMAQPVANTLYFAGEHTDIDGHWGTVHAALKSGVRSAEQILATAP